MAPNRDSSLPSGSIGLTGASTLQRAPSKESLNAHPLLASNSPPQPQFQSTSLDSTNTPRYVPYTPRHRPPTSSISPGTTTQILPTTSYSEASATSRLQAQNLKAAAQSIGLGSGTLGWAILEKLVEIEISPQWDDIRTILQHTKPTLLLPLEPLSGEIITPQIVKEHLAICATVSSTVVTLTGLRGNITSGNLVIQSTIPTTSRAFIQLLKADSQVATFASLAPLPSFSTHVSDTLPSFAITGSRSLSLLLRMYKPPLPPRPGPSPGSKIPASRLANPFASLFGRPATPVQQSLPSPSSSTLTPASLSPAIDDAQSGHTGIDLFVYAIGRKMNGTVIRKEVSAIIQQEIKTRLSSCPDWVVNRVLDFTYSFRSTPKSAQIESQVDQNPLVPDTATLEDCLQSLYTSIEDDIHAGNAVYDRPNKVDGDGFHIEIERKGTDIRKHEILEQVENVVCEVFYDRLFSPLSGDDASHDEALANRIAALNMLDLALEHLGVEIPNEQVGEGVKSVVNACGAILQRLEDPDNHIPSRKVGLLVRAHQEIVAGLSKLPKLRLKSDTEMNEQSLRTPRASSFAKRHVDKEETVPPKIRIDQVELDTSSNDITPEIEEDASDLSTESVLEPIISDSVVTIKPDAQSPHTDETIDTETNQGKSSEPTPISGDILFPFLIFSVVKSNPPHLASHLLFTQRFRSRSVGGQESYCLINFMAVIEFLENVDMSALGLGDSERVMSTAELSPIPLQVSHGPMNAHDPRNSPVSSFSIPQLGRRVNQQVGELAELAGSANKVLTGVVDSSFGMLRGMLGSTPTDLSTPRDELQDSAPWNALRPGFGLLKRGSGFSINSVTGRPKTFPEEEGRQLVEVSSRPSSVKELSVYEDDYESGSNLTTDDEEEGEHNKGDAKSIRSFSSMISRESRQRDREREGIEGRAKLADRLASMTKLGHLDSAGKDSPPPSRSNSRPSSWLPPRQENTAIEAISTPSLKVRLQPPNRRFLECDEQDIRMGEVGELLREYRRMVHALQTANMFEESS